MQVGFMALEVGVVKAKVVKAAIFKNLFDHAVGTLAWYLIGYSLFLGTDPFASGPEVMWFAHDPLHYARIFQQYAFAVTAATIVSGAVISRCRLEVYLVFCFLLSAYIYPIVAHLCWNENGWLAQQGFLDFAGGGVVHLLGGSAAFVGAAACGPRIGRFIAVDEKSESRVRRAGSEDNGGGSALGLGSLKEMTEHAESKPRRTSKLWSVLHNIKQKIRADFRVRETPGHSASMQGLGALFLYIAWFSFNGGSGGVIDSETAAHLAGKAVVNTMLASASASITGLVWAKLFHESYSMDLGVNSLLSGLVAVTAPCGYVEPWAALVIGVMSVPVYIATSNVVLYLCKVDDPLNAVAVHAFNGALGTVWIGFAEPTNGVFYSGNGTLLGVQCLGCAIIIAWTVANAAIYFYGMKFLWPLMPKRCREEKLSAYDQLMQGDKRPNCLVYGDDVQLVGMDFVYFGGSSFPDFDVEAVAEFNETKRIKERVIARNHRISRQVESRENSETSLHWKDLSVHNKLKNVGSLHSFGTPKNSESNLLQQPSPKNSTFAYSNNAAAANSAPSSPRNSQDNSA